METSNNTHNSKGRMSRGLHITYIVSVLICIVGGALSIPFVYESQTLWYKIGIDKTLLRAGKIAGLLAAILLFVQIVLGVRGKILEELFGVRNLVLWHRINGVFILFLALCHVSLVLVPEGIVNLPIGLKYWPEMVGALLLSIILSMVISSQFRQQLGFAYVKWRAIHKPLGYSALVLIFIHVLFVSESFEYIVPRVALIIAVTAVVIAVFRVKRAAFRKKRQSRK
jgi:predicted ferric reductase